MVLLFSLIMLSALCQGYLILLFDADPISYLSFLTPAVIVLSFWVYIKYKLGQTKPILTILPKQDSSDMSVKSNSFKRHQMD